MIEEINNTHKNETETKTENECNAGLEAPIANIVTIGELLRSKREEKGLNLKTISYQTKIHMGLLEHLEKNELTKLPSKTYVRGFVKSAAKILNINQEEALNALDATYNSNISKKSIKLENSNYEMRNETARNTLASMTSTPLGPVKSVTTISSTFLTKFALGIVILGVVGFNIKNLIDRTAEERSKLPQVFSTIHQKLKPAPKAVLPKAIPKMTETELATPPSPIKVNIIQDKKEANQKSEITIKDVNLKNISLGEKQFTEDNSLTDTQLEEFFPSRYKVHVSKGIENLFINAVDGDSWVTYKVDDKEIKKYVLRQGRTIFLRGEKIRLFLGNTKSVKIFYNNKLITLNAKNAVRNLVFPEELKTKYMSPLFIFQKDGTAVTSDDYIKNNQNENSATDSGNTVPPDNKNSQKIRSLEPSAPITLPTLPETVKKI